MSSRRLRFAAACGALLMTGALTLAAPAGADTPTAEPVGPAKVDNFALFDEGKHEKIAEHAISLINAANGGSINITLYYFDRQAVANALIAAAKRGVKVRIVMDGWNIGEKEYDSLIAASKAPTPKNERVAVATCSPATTTRNGGKVATRGCIANRGLGDDDAVLPAIMHNKFMTLSSVQTTAGTVNNVVYVSSANLDWWKGRNATEKKAYGNVVTLTSPELHGFFADHYFEDLFNGPNTTGNNTYGDPDPDPETDNNFHSANHEVFTSPRQYHDPIGAAIERASRTCSTTTTDDVIKVANFRISRSNVTGILGFAKKRGCTVQVVTGDIGDKPRTPVKEYWRALLDLAEANIDIKVCHPSMGVYSEMHEKTLMINHGPTAGLYIGSANMTEGALKYGDESVLRIMKTSPVWPKFDQHFDALHNYCPTWNPLGDRRSPANSRPDNGDVG
ncbi:phospholipase D-like domain-containing protein [Spirillospora sp. NBC_00431]